MRRGTIENDEQYVLVKAQHTRRGSVVYMSTAAAITIFVSYTHSEEDEALCQILTKHLQAMQRQRLIQVWSDRNIDAGVDWSQQMSQYLNTAEIILLLISPDFVASDHHYNSEMQRAMERHETQKAWVIPIILRPISWEGAPFAALQTLPTDGKPVTAWPDPDTAFEDIEKNIRQVVRELQAIEEAHAHMAGERYDQALAAYERIFQFNRRSAAAYAGKGDALLSLEYFSKALDAYGQALQLNPTHPAYESGRGAALLGLKQPQEALSAFNQAISLDPTIATALRGKGDALFQLRRYGEALEAYDKALRLNANNTHLYVSRGYVFEQLAQQSFEKAQELGHSEEIHMEQINHSRTQMQALPMKIEKLTLVRTINLPESDPKSSQSLPSFMRDESLYLNLTAIAMSPDGKFLAGAPKIADPGKTFGAILWDMETGEEVRTVGKFNGHVACLLFSSDGQTLLSCGRLYEKYHERSATSLKTYGDVFRAYGEILGISEKREETYEEKSRPLDHDVIQAWSVKTGALIRKNPLPSKFSCRLMSANGQVLVGYQTIPNQNRSLGVLGLGTGKSSSWLSIEDYSGSSDVVRAISSDGNLIVGGQPLTLWDAPTGKILHMISGDMPIPMIGAAISPDTQIVASSYENGVIKLWNPSTAQLLYAFVGHESLSSDPNQHRHQDPFYHYGLTNPLTFSTDGHQLVSVAGGEIKMWEIERLP